MQSRQRIARLAPLHEIEAAIASFEPVAAATVPILNAIGAVLAAPITLSEPVPAQAIAARDGWAVASADTVDASSYSPMPLTQTPVWIEAGQPLVGASGPDGVHGDRLDGITQPASRAGAGDRRRHDAGW